MLPNHLSASIDKKFICREEIYQWFQELGNIPDEEMHTTFNCGLGLVLSISKDDQKNFEDLIQSEGLDVFEIGHLEINNSSRCKIS